MNDDRLRELFSEHVPHVRHDRWFTRRVMNRLPRKKMSIEAKVSLTVLLMILLICMALCVVFACSVATDACWNCPGTWVMYGALTAACILLAVQLSSFLRSVL